MVLLLLKVFGVRRVAGWALWLMRALLSLGLVVGFILVWVYGGEQARWRLGFYGAVGLVIAGIQALWRRSRKVQAPDAPPGERTIDGKVVPDMLVASALAVPERSPDGEYVLRALPDYGKGLLKLDTADFQYVPELPGYEPKLLMSPVAPPAVSRSAFGISSWALAAGGVALLAVIGVGVGFYQASRDAQRQPTMQDSSVAAAESGQEKPPLEAKGALSGPPPTVETAPPPVADSALSNAEAPRLAVEPPIAASEKKRQTAAAPETQPAQDDVMKQFNDFKRLADEGNPRAQYYVSLLYENRWQGIGVSEAVGQLQSKYWLLNSALAGDVKAQVRLGENYMKGIRGFDRDTQAGAECLNKVIAQAPEESPERKEALALLKEQ